ncbi:MAG: exodeoxyribonuclease VII small subunit [Bacteroidales bacterium]|jgi:exodeoxyribonuclease VII small subunit|nr:exodeoxyribonuclease VII small subunit [Bacteroidales bacterium]
MEEKLTYSEAFGELKELVDTLEGSDVAIDELAVKIKRAEVLIGICKAKLLETEQQSQQIFDKLEQQPEDEK